MTVVDADTGAGIANVDLWRQTDPDNREAPVDRRELPYFRSWSAETRMVHSDRPRTDAQGRLTALFPAGKHRIGVGLQTYPIGYRCLESEGVEIDCQPGQPVQVKFTMRNVLGAAAPLPAGAKEP